MNKPFRVGIAGLGTVGAGIVKLLEVNREAIAARAGRPVEIAVVSARDRTRARGVDLSRYDWLDDAVALAARDDVDCVVEMIGGADGPAKALAEAAFGRGKPLVTANKALIAHHGQALAEAAEAADTGLFFEAAVAGGIPVLRGLRAGLAANRMTRVFGVLNGTCNYILNEMEARGADYADVLTDAQRLGYAEADPSFDVGGIDAAHKLAILASIAFGTRIDFEGVVTEGIERITLADIETARDMGYSIRLLGVARMHDTGLEQRVRPCMVPENTVIGALPGVTNAVIAEGDFIGQCSFVGPGAGEGPTASAAVGDIIDAARGEMRPGFGQPAVGLGTAARLAHGEEHSPYYLRVMLSDRPGALAQVATALGTHDVSIHRMRQYGKDDPVPVVIVTHDCRRDRIDAALETIAELPVSLAPPVAIRIEEA